MFETSRAARPPDMPARDSADARRVKPIVGVLALQGDFDAHAHALEECEAEPREIRRIEQIDGVTALVIPGGESTTLLRLMREWGFDEAVPRFVREGGAVYGTCAGAILLAREVTSPSQWSMGLIDITVQRNGFGRQAESFETKLESVDATILALPALGLEIEGSGTPSRLVQKATPPFDRVEDSEQPSTARRPREHSKADGAPPCLLPAVFIRAPRILHVGSRATVLASFRDEPVIVREGAILVSTFHPELTPDRRVHRYFLDRVVPTAAGAGSGRAAR